MTAVADRGSADLRATLAGPLAVEVMTEALGLDATPADVLRIYRAIVHSVEALSAGSNQTDAGDAAMSELAALIGDAVARGAPLLEERTRRLAAAEVASNVAVVMFGGVETGEGMTANALWHLLSNPDQMAEARDDRSLIDNAIEESLRMEPAATRVDRYATDDVTIGRAEVSRGDLVIVSLAGANRDPDVFHDPDRFDLHRSTARLNVTFAHGPHTCLANHLARAETKTAITAVLDVLPGLELADEAVPPTGLVFRKPKRLPVTW